MVDVVDELFPSEFPPTLIAPEGFVHLVDAVVSITAHMFDFEGPDGAILQARWQDDEAKPEPIRPAQCSSYDQEERAYSPPFRRRNRSGEGILSVTSEVRRTVAARLMRLALIDGSLPTYLVPVRFPGFKPIQLHKCVVEFLPTQHGIPFILPGGIPIVLRGFVPSRIRPEHLFHFTSGMLAVSSEELKTWSDRSRRTRRRDGRERRHKTPKRGRGRPVSDTTEFEVAVIRAVRMGDWDASQSIQALLRILPERGGNISDDTAARRVDALGRRTGHKGLLRAIKVRTRQNAVASESPQKSQG